MANVLFSAFMEACIPYLWYTNKIKNLALIFVFKIFVSRLQVKMAQNVKTKRSLNRDFKKIYIYIYIFLARVLQTLLRKFAPIPLQQEETTRLRILMIIKIDLSI